MAGTIRKRGSSYQALLRYTDPTTHRSVQLSASAPSKREAETRLAELIRQRDAGARPGKQTFGYLVERWLVMQTDKKASPASMNRYRQAFDPNGRIMRRFGELKLAEITPAMIDEYLGGLSRQGLAPNTILWDHNIIKGLFAQAERWDWVARNPSARVSVAPARPRSHIELPSDAEVEKLLVAADEFSPILGAYVRLDLALGTRRGELCAVRVRDIDLDDGAGMVRIGASAVYGGKGTGIVVKEPKTEAGVRSIAIGAGSVAMLGAFLAWRREQAAKLGGSFGPEAFVFSASPLGDRPGNPNSMTMNWRLVRARVGLDHVRLHDLRHLAITSMLVAGVPLHIASARSGHARSSITADLYAQFLPAVDRQAAEVMDWASGVPTSTDSAPTGR